MTIRNRYGFPQLYAAVRRCSSMRTRRQTSIGIPVALSLGLVLSACGAGSTPLESGAASSSVPSTEAPAESPTTSSTRAGTESTAAGTESTAPAEDTTAPGVNNFPDATALDVDSGEPFNLRMLADSGTPVAMWFYYPH